MVVSQNCKIVHHTETSQATQHFSSVTQHMHHEYSYTAGSITYLQHCI